VTTRRQQLERWAAWLYAGLTADDGPHRDLAEHLLQALVDGAEFLGLSNRHVCDGFADAFLRAALEVSIDATPTAFALTLAVYADGFAAGRVVDRRHASHEERLVELAWRLRGSLPTTRQAVTLLLERASELPISLAPLSRASA
jgi:hypothetical protein